MNARNPLMLVALVVSLPLAIAGCGNKGPLVMPDEVAPVEAADTGTDTTPELDPAPFDPIPIDPATVPDSPPEPGTADDGNG